MLICMRPHLCSLLCEVQLGPTFVIMCPYFCSFSVYICTLPSQQKERYSSVLPILTSRVRPRSVTAFKTHVTTYARYTYMKFAIQLMSWITIFITIGVSVSEPHTSALVWGLLMLTPIIIKYLFNSLVWGSLRFTPIKYVMLRAK